MGRTSGALLVATLGIGAVETQAAGLVSVDTFDIGGVAITPPAPAPQNSFLGVTPGGSVPAGQRYMPTATLPAGPRTRTEITHQIVLR